MATQLIEIDFFYREWKFILEHYKSPPKTNLFIKMKMHLNQIRRGIDSSLIFVLPSSFSFCVIAPKYFNHFDRFATLEY